MTDGKRVMSTVPLYPRIQTALVKGLEAIVPDVALDEHRYVVDPQDNLLPGIDLADIEREFGAGAGKELQTKMRAPWSSSALAVNSFARWRDADRLHLAGLGDFSAPLAFEAQCPNGVSSIPPHLDVLLERGDMVVGVESKCAEPFRGNRHGPVSKRYLALRERGDPRAGTRWFAALAQVPEFHLLDAYQLVKHFLGLAKQYDGRPLMLVYLYWEPSNPEHELFASHRAEVERFAGLVAGDAVCDFAALSYREHWDELNALAERAAWADEHLANLRRRYLVEL